MDVGLQSEQPSGSGGRLDLHRTLFALWGLATLLLVIAVALLMVRVAAQREDLAALTAPVKTYGAGDGGLESRGTRDVRLYFARTDRTALESETRRIEFTERTAANCRAALEALVEGPHSPLAPILPPGTRIRGMYLLGNGELVVDFSRDLEAGMVASATAELLMIQGVTASMCQPSLRGRDGRPVSAVRFLFEGSEPQDTFPEHIDLSGPVVPDARLIDVWAQDRDNV